MNPSRFVNDENDSSISRCNGRVFSKKRSSSMSRCNGRIFSKQSKLGSFGFVPLSMLPPRNAVSTDDIASSAKLPPRNSASTKTDPSSAKLPPRNSSSTKTDPNERSNEATVLKGSYIGSTVKLQELEEDERDVSTKTDPNERSNPATVLKGSYIGSKLKLQEPEDDEGDNDDCEYSEKEIFGSSEDSSSTRDAESDQGYKFAGITFPRRIPALKPREYIMNTYDMDEYQRPIVYRCADDISNIIDEYPGYRRDPKGDQTQGDLPSFRRQCRRT